MSEELKLRVMRTQWEQIGLMNLISAVKKNIGSGLKMVEIGSYAGESSEIWAKSGIFDKVICVDAWKNGYDQTDYASKTAELAENKFDEIASKYPCIEKCKCASLEAAGKFANGSLDLVYIDAMHTYDAVKADIEAWLPKIRKGGVISGHDYSDAWNGVVRAVNEKFGKPDQLFRDFSWVKRV